MKVKLYIEGGGDSPLQDTLFRQGWDVFFAKAGLKGKMSTFRGGSREATFDAFQIAWKNRRQNECPVLLVDSEEVPEEASSAWEFLNQRDNWTRPEGASDEAAFLMICCMETWFVADKESLRQFFKNGWRDKAIPAWPSLEKVPKDSIFKALDAATKACKTRYSKGKVSFELLSEIEPGPVRQKCPAADALLNCLNQLSCK